ncbi:hypothetical protein [Bifidobacterium castoris]|uniref:Uncharacterized protein n=1 Tax=Bifidobacterium castoris TaxID=2306972 RepID=A0A430F8B2_9BIFI|nr:hypothetical protein [Bifidobacterium castoris]RSX48937.1 hypothetical protein D2E22_1075 [Bifidobacterium castoris]
MPNTISTSLEDGMLKTVFVPNIADIKAPKVSELKGAGVVDLSYYLAGDGYQLNHTQEMIDDDREGSATVGQIPGQDKFDGGTMQVIDNTNVEGADNAAVEMLTRGKTGYIVRRRGLPTDEDFAADQTVAVHKVTIGIKTPVAHAPNQRQMSTISFSADPGSQDEDVKIVAGS